VCIKKESHASGHTVSMKMWVLAKRRCIVKTAIFLLCVMKHGEGEARGSPPTVCIMEYCVVLRAYALLGRCFHHLCVCLTVCVMML
jgi:hypothetical protein